MTLPRGKIGSVLIRDDTVRRIKTMLTALVGLEHALPANVVPVAGIDPAQLVRRGEASDLTSNSGSIPMSNRSVLRLAADECLTSVELVEMTEGVAVELAERLIAEFPAPAR
jgi:hypothetical protein